ncbi:uncharacterized protein EDB91DRAFT_1279772 [Suillus paluster]|uniref:uncharacterized protein n=1 Tax=Suillus paluster TaxID=48578 RepID=UPI001B86A3A2|nr:uncharacterized protein EDB91DRAFT_1279772 [Suillus paluster]KAG1720822.1 hypothetical protein EDB91DRAFT_1279772 [Suillus paluster]
MNRLISDPSTEICPDFTSNFYQTSRALLVALNNTEEQAAVLLQAVWTATNTAQRTQWQNQIAADQIAAAEQQHHADDEAQQQLQNILVSDFALCKLEKGHHVEIYYWTNKGLSDARLHYRTTDDEGMVPTTGPDGATTWMPANAMRPSTAVIPDHSLSPLEFAQAIPQLVVSLTERGWDEERVHMLAAFWGTLMLHRYWSSDSPLDQRALLMYQEEQRQAWHQAIPMAGGAWDISILDETEINRTLDRIYREDCRRHDNDYDYQVCYSITFN